MIIRGTTPTLRLTVPETVDLTEASMVYATIKQGKTAITKSGNDLEVEAHRVSVYLSQEESLDFCEADAEVQLNWLYEDGRRNATIIKKIPFGKQLVGKVLP